MTKVLLFYNIIAGIFLTLNGEVYLDRPKIKTSDGDLILEAGYNKNIYLRPNGPASSVFVGEVNILRSKSKPDIVQAADGSLDVQDQLNEPREVLQLLKKLENKLSVRINDLQSNNLILWRKVNRLNRRVFRLQVQVNNLGVDECQSSHCQHGGTCLDLANGYRCLCPANWEGTDCDIDVNECRNFAGTDLGCQNGATCINEPGDYKCECTPGWFGLHCTRKANDCSGGDFEMCGHGTCSKIETGEGITCTCNQGWTTNGTEIACLTDVNECDSQSVRCSVNPKVECINLPGSFRCERCPQGYEGDGYTCADIDECITLPNGGCSPMVTCHNTIGSRICGPCPPGYEGDGIKCSWRGSCRRNNGGCHPSAQCLENLSLGQIVQCVCPNDMAGDGVGLHGCYISTGSNFTDSCADNPCGTKGQCHVLRSGYTCICQWGYSGSHCDVQTNFCLVNPCRNGGICRQDNSVTSGYRCECTAQYSGPHCQIQSKPCGGVLDAEEGSIVFPIFNTTYTHNSKCAWVIHTVPSKVVNVTFSKFYVEESPDCAYDFLQIHDGRSSATQLVGRFCGNSFPKGGSVISSHNNLYLWFRSDGSIAKDGFALHWNSIDPVCGGEIDAKIHGHISSPGSPGKYPPNRDCYWHLTTSLGKKLQIVFFALDIESHSNCSFDYLAIYDGMKQTDPLLNWYCNSTQPPPILSAGSEMLIHFHSDEYGSGNGFQIAYAPVPGVPGCGGYFTTDKGEITAPTLDGIYLSNVLCEYKIKSSIDTKIRIDFKQFSIEESAQCEFDYLKVYDGPSEESPLVGKFCGTTHPKFYIASSNILFIIFRSDNAGVGEGFKLSYETLCQESFHADSGVIKSPGYPFSYPKNKVCEYVISTTPGKVIQLNFQDFDIKDNTIYYVNNHISTSKCLFDHVEIRDGTNINSTLLGKYCGGSDHIPPAQLSTHNYMYIKFYSDRNVTGTGFYANYTTIATDCGGIYRDTTGLINYSSGDMPMSNEIEHSCSWILIAPEGMHIMLTWHRFNLEIYFTMWCNLYYLQLVEIDDIKGNNNEIGKFCGPKTPPAITTFSNHLMITIKSSTTYRQSSFSVSYAFLDEKSHCGGVLYKSHGIVYSPGWPASYEINQDCTWVITVPAGQHIRLNISQFDLEAAIYGTCRDFLEIRNGATLNSPLIGQYCGKFKSKLVTSLANSLYIRFLSDNSFSGHGFKLEWDGSIFGCGGTLTSPTGSIASPNYPDSDEHTECFYRIVTSLASQIRISFTDLNLEPAMGCIYDYVEIFDGRDSDATSLGKHCYMSVELNNIETTSNYAFIKYRSDRYTRGKGFFLNYFTTCNKNLTGRYGVIESPDYPNYYPLSLNCLWNIDVPKGNRINVTFTNYDLLNKYDRYFWIVDKNCGSNYVQWKEITETKFNNKYCRFEAPPMITTKSNSLQIKHSIGLTGSKVGFRLEWVSYGCGGHIQKRFGTVSVDKGMGSSEALECEWLIETPIGTSVTLFISEMFITETLNCTVDAVKVYNGQDINSPLISTVCHRGILTVQSTANYMLIKFIKSSPLNDAYFISSFYALKSTCGGTIESHSGYIYSKNYPNNYDNNLDCIWNIHVPYNHRIQINFIDFDLYYNRFAINEDCGDSIKIFDHQILTAHVNYTSIICPDSTLRQFISNYNNIRIQFTSDDYGSAKGFKASFSVTCGAFITAINDGLISKDNYIGSTNKNCTWTIRASEPDQKISLTITHIFLPKLSEIISNKSCSSSYLRVYDGDNIDAPIIDEYCGKKVPPMIVSRGSAITVLLGSYSNYSKGNFAAHYSALSEACGGTLTSEEGTIASPNYPHSYPIGSDCEWTLSTSPGNKVYVTFEHFDVEYSDRCNEDYLEIRENDGAGKLLGVYCGPDMPINTTTASKLYLKFHSNDKNSGQGFVLHYGFLHGNELINMEQGDIASPLYPNLYQGAAIYSWRIQSEGLEDIVITVDDLEIPSFGNVCNNYLSIYDGFDDTAPLLAELCGKLRSAEILQTSSNMAYIKLSLGESNSGSIFHLSWAKKNIDGYNKKLTNCGSNYTEFVSAGNFSIFSSPHFPGNYDDDLTCEWIFQTTSGRHLRLNFIEFELEETSHCLTDYVNIYSSDILGEWKSIKENICESQVAMQETNITNYLKVTFNTDLFGNRKGFQGEVASVCGGSITELSGEVGLTWNDTVNNGRTNCEWTIKVRPGRIIDFRFSHFNISTENNNCFRWVILRNGGTAEAPLLGSGKYCGLLHENNEQLTTSSNSLYISYNEIDDYSFPDFQNFEIRYEEKNIECGVTSKLDAENSWEVINSPNYPLIPPPFSECIWIFTGPPGEILRIDFIDRFDLDSSNDCSSEFIEIHDGFSNLSPNLGRYCRKRPGTIKTTNNALFIRYLSQLSEPRNGFKANVSIDICGGTIISDNGEIKSPGYPHMTSIANNLVCEWRVKGNPRHVFKITLQDMSLPKSEKLCTPHVTIEENMPGENNTAIIEKYCNRYLYRNIVETSTNEFIIKFYIGNPDKWNLESRGFRFTYNSFRPACGGDVVTSEGYLTTPSYPLETVERYCYWYIVVPDQTRRVRLELVDTDEKKHSLSIYLDKTFSHNIIEHSPTTHVYESTGNKMLLLLIMKSTATRHRFKAKFSSDEEILCGGNLNGINGELSSPNLERAYTCEWSYNSQRTKYDDIVYNSILVTASVNSSSVIDSRYCRRFDSKLNIVASLTNQDMSFNRDLCGTTEKIFRIPAIISHITAVQTIANTFSFHLTWKMQPCGGIINIGEIPVNILQVPNNTNDTLDCAWMIMMPFNKRIELKIEGHFQYNCEDEFIKIGEGISQTAPTVGDYCDEKTLHGSLILDFMYINIQYHRRAANSSHNIRLIAKTVKGQCGEEFSYSSMFSSPNYPKSYESNEECSWLFTADLGMRVSLIFTERFAIEDTPNCTKDAVIIYDWKYDMYNEIARLCGREIPPPFNSTYNKMKVVLRTDATTNLDGFTAFWKPLCGGHYLATDNKQILYSPMFPNAYPPMSNCIYTINAPDDKKLLLQFLELELEGKYPDCIYDNVTIIGENIFSYIYATYCENKLPPVISNNNKITILFKSDQFNEKRGFKLSFQIYECGGSVNESTVLSSQFGDSYSTNENCTWFIEAPRDKVVLFKFQLIDLESHYECSNDFVAIYDDFFINHDKRLALMCGHVNSTTVLKSHGNKALLQFVSNEMYVFKGFKVDVSFTYSEAVGCGGRINLTTSSTKTFRSPLVGKNVVYENYLDCHWTITSPEDTIVKIEFTSFHISSCLNVNQTEIGFSKCDCDWVEIKDGINPNSFVIGSYCGNTFPPTVHSSANQMSVRLSTDGELNSSGFEARLTVQQSICGQSQFAIGYNVTRLQSPGYEKGVISRGIQCVYYMHQLQTNSEIRISIVDLDLQAPYDQYGKKICNKDKLVITNSPVSRNVSLGKDYITNHGMDETFISTGSYYYEDAPILARKMEYCGSTKPSDLYVTGNVMISLTTSPESDSKIHRGVDIEVATVGFCGRNYTGTQGKIQGIPYYYVTDNTESHVVNDCYTLVTAPDNHTISAYLISINPAFWNDNVYLDVYDGNNTSCKKLLTINKTYIDQPLPLFTTGRYMLMHNHAEGNDRVAYNLNFITTDKGRGCGGKLSNELGRITSPMYPDIYRQKSSCEWELETPIGTRLKLHFVVFDLGRSCDQNYLQLVDSNGVVVSSYCSENPADYTSSDNFVKLVFHTTMNNGGTGWVADFVGII